MTPIQRLGGLLAAATSLAVLVGAGCGNDARQGAAASSGSHSITTLPAASGPSAEGTDDLADVSACTGVTLSPSLASPQTTGPSVVFTATASCGAKTPEYAFHLDTREGGFVLQQGYSTANTWTWPTSGLLPGHYAVRVKVRVPGKSGVQAHTSVDYHLDCVPKTCADQGAECGVSPDECGGMLNCGACPAGTQCNAAGPPLRGGTCGACDYSYPYTCFDCAAAGFNCGWVEAQFCGNCKAPETCGGGGVANQCGSGFPGCLPRTCADLGVECGLWDDGCGGFANGCVGCDNCRAGGTPGVCGSDPKPCVPITCEEYGFECGYVQDGCEAYYGTYINCGVGGGALCKDRAKTCVNFKCEKGDAGIDDAGECVPFTCDFYGAECGDWSDGCGGGINCGSCPAYTLCGGDGTPGVCGVGTPCVPLTCAFFGFDCGTAPDGCGGTLECGACKAPKTCGGGSPGRGNRCGH